MAQEIPDVRAYGYREPRVPCPLSLHLEVSADGETEAIPVRGIDISASGVAIAVGEDVELAENVELSIRCGEDELRRIPGHVYYQALDQYGLEFKFATEEQRQRVVELIEQFLHTI
jgi:hypothetical protein